MNNVNKPQPLIWATIFAVTLLFFTVGLSQQEIIRFDSRFYLFAIEMQRYGLSWFPTTYHQPYPDYPATSTVMIVFFAKLFGMLNKAVAVLPTAIAAAATAAMTYAIAARENKQWGIIAVCFLLLNINFLAASRSLALDMYPTLITVACFYLITSKEKIYTGILLFLITLGFVFRGPIGLVIPTGVICSYYLLNADYKRCLTFGFSALALLLLGIAVLLLLAHHTGGVSFMHDVWRMEAAGRINEKALPFYFYFLDSLSNDALSFPVACLVVGGVLFYAIKQTNLAQKQLLLKLTAWCGIVIIGMSIPGDKKTRYILPMMPAVALLAAYPFVAPSSETYFRFLRRFLTTFLFFTPITLLVGLLVFNHITLERDLLLPIAYSFILSVLSMLQLLSIFCLFLMRTQRVALICIIAAISFVFIYLKVVEPVQQFLDQSRSLIQQVENQRVNAKADLVFYKEHPDGLPIKYLVNVDDVVSPIFIEDAKTLQQYAKPSYVVTSRENTAELPGSYHIIAQGNLGHRPIVVFKNS